MEVTEGIELGDRVVVGPYRSLDQLKEGSLIEFEDDKAKTADDADGTTDKKAESDASKTNDKMNEKAEDQDHRAAALAENREG